MKQGIYMNTWNIFEINLHIVCDDATDDARRVLF